MCCHHFSLQRLLKLVLHLTLSNKQNVNHISILLNIHSTICRVCDQTRIKTQHVYAVFVVNFSRLN